jgi:hypothetical protein
MVLSLLVLTGCVTERKTIVLTGNVLVDGPYAISNGPPKDRILWEDRTAVAAMRVGNFQLAKDYLDDVITRLGGVYGPDASAKKARGYFHEESTKTFIGEPYERVMAYYYRGILYWKDGELDNARACFRSGEIEDSSSEGEQYSGDYALLDYLDGLATVQLHGDGSDAFTRAKKEMRSNIPPPPYDPNANALFFIEFGRAVRKYATGRYHEELRFDVPPSRAQSAMVSVDNQTATVAPYDDLGYQATTRGGRVMDHVLANKAVFKDATGAAGQAAIIGGAATALSTRNQTAQEVGLGLMAAGVITEFVSSAARPEADVRTWDNLPRYLTFAAMHLSPGQHQATVQFYDRDNLPLPDLTKTINFTVTGDKHDTVVFVSDKSPTPQTI